MRGISFVILFLLVTINAYAIIPIYCPNCKEHIYDYQKDEIISGSPLLAKDFKPVNDDIPQPQETDEMLCPYCHKNFDGWNYYADYWKCKVTNYVNSVVLLTKDNLGFKWIPYNITSTPYSRE